MAKKEQAQGTWTPWPPVSPAGTAITNDVNGVNFVSGIGERAIRSSFDRSHRPSNGNYDTGPEKEASR